MKARGGTRWRETWTRDLRGVEERLRAHEPRSGGSRDDGGDQFRPSRRGDLSRPDPPWKIFQREGTAPEKISGGGSRLKNLFSDSIRSLKFFSPNIFSKPICDGINNTEK